MVLRDRAPRRVTPRAPGWTAAWTIAPSSTRWLTYRPTPCAWVHGTYPVRCVPCVSTLSLVQMILSRLNWDRLTA